MKGPVALDQDGELRLGDGQGGFFEGFKGDVRVDLFKGGKEAAEKDDLMIVAALRRGAVRGDVGSVGVVVAGGSEPVETELLQVVLGDWRHWLILQISSQNNGLTNKAIAHIL